MSLWVLFWLMLNSAASRDVRFTIKLRKITCETDPRFLSVALGSWQKKDLHRIEPLANGLSGGQKKPLMYLRVGGNSQDHSQFQPTMFNYNESQFNSLYKFAADLHWKFLFGLNALDRYPNGTWDPTNAMQLFDFIKKQQFKVNFQLDNEFDLYPTHQNVTVTPKQLAEDFKTLRHLVNNYFPEQKILLVGPDVATLTRYHDFSHFLKSLDEGVIDAISFHHYYSSSDNITVNNFTSVKYLDRFLRYGQHAMAMIKRSYKFVSLPVWITETSSTYDGGSKTVGESYAAGFVWLDKLGLAAQMNVKLVARQALQSAHYSLIGNDFTPNPDYWTSLLYKQLVGSRVLNISGYLSHRRKVRLYAHCTNPLNEKNYKPGSVVIFALNLLQNKKAVLRFKDEKYSNLPVDTYLLSPVDGCLSCRQILLNGQLLTMESNSTSPVHGNFPVTMPPLTYGYFVVNETIAHACL